ncbi:MAG: hypothetical protein JXR73_20470, partial [Candidatus Omnitrophica bacterium]|nr:hypothetical protein [Candidatus Omnitrophota bacterium]
HETLENEIDPLLPQMEDAAAVRFDPMVFCRLEQAERVYPAGLSLECPFTCEYGERGGIYFDVRFAPAPATVILHPRYEEIRDSNSTPECLMHAQTRLALESHYRSTPAFNFTVFHRESRRRDILYDWLWSAYDDGCDFEAQRLPGWFADRFDAASNPDWELDDEAIHKPAGAAWTFETGYDRTQQIGLAFGSQPTSAQRGAGVFSAESGNRITAGRMGILKSEPFILEGDDLRFYANLPQDSTATFFCLAVYEEVPFGGESPIQQARHLFERKTGESLAGDAFFYVQPQHLSYLPERIRGWHVVRALQTSEKPGWRRYLWSVDPWKDKQAIWLAADRDPRHAMAVDQIIQWKRAPGLYANFEKGGYEDWTYVGKAFGDRPATGPIGDQTTIHGLEGNYFINTYFQGSDAAKGTLMSPRFELTGDQMEFRIGGGADLERLYVGLRIDDRLVRRATGDNSETMRLVQWDVSPWVGKIVRIEIADLSSDLWGHILADDIRIHPSLRLKIQAKGRTPSIRSTIQK